MEKIPRDSVVTVGATSTELSPETTPTKRNVVVITNISTGGQVITLGIGKEAIANAGIVLYAGMAWEESIDNTFKPTMLRISAISSAVGGSVSIHERVEE